ncbi:hypothetical protein SDC9_51809 [bioreactor metagenome]|uniref:Alcohol acetyltransferase n=1 Tax=bioreactor metagenome TaxID=1076179 RepID=A0A644WPB4_9ZZZZ
MITYSNLRTRRAPGSFGRAGQGSKQILKKVQPSRFEEYCQSLPNEKRLLLDAFFLRASDRLALDSVSNRLMLRDFQEAVLWYAGQGTPLENALNLLDPVHLGGYYARPALLWYPLDDAAKIYPLSMKHNSMAVFRVSICLNEAVVPALLQMALTFTIKRFPSFATTLKQGFFWHYLDAAKRRFVVEPELDLPCQPLDVSGSGSQSFRVLYFEKRISVEFFHVLADGTGAMIFLNTLAAEYLRLLGVAVPAGGGIKDVDASPTEEETENGFINAQSEERASGFVNKSAVQMSGRLSVAKPCRILHFHMDAERLKETAKSKNASVTAYILALMFLAQKDATDGQAGDVAVQIPVNMRKFYPSGTLRNFSLYCGVRLPLRSITTLDAILPEIARQLETKASESAMKEMMSAIKQLARSLRFVPLFIKKPAARIIYGFLGDRIFSSTLSNIGVIRLPDEMTPYVDHYEIVLARSSKNRASCALATYQNTTTLSIGKFTADPSFEETLYRLLSAEGLEAVVEGSALYER